MHKDFEQRKQELEKQKLDVLGQQFILDSQLECLKNQAKELQATKKEHDTNLGKQLFDMEKRVKDTAKAKFGIENDLRAMVNSNEQESAVNFSNKMTLDNNEQFGALNSERF